MRIYIIGNDGIRLCHEAPTTVNEGEIAVASNEELLAAPLSGKRLLALWNALPGVEKRRKIGDRGALIDQLWSAIEALPEPEPPFEAKRPSKQDEVIAMLRRAEGDRMALPPGGPCHLIHGHGGLKPSPTGRLRRVLLHLSYSMALSHLLDTTPPSLFTTAACGGLRPAPDYRSRRALLHLSYSSAPVYSDGASVTHAPIADLEAGCGNWF